MKKLLRGIKDFRQHKLQEYREKYSKLAYGQAPDTLFVGCCDSRVVPNSFASTDPGDLFVLRNIGNLIPPYGAKDAISVAAAIEFSTLVLNISYIVICGHSDCGAMRAFTDNTMPSPGSAIEKWLSYAKPSYEKLLKLNPLPPEPHNALSHINVVQQLEHLKTYPEVKARLDSGKLSIHGWWFDLATADVYQYDPDSQEFAVIK
ncbi:MAG TPA: carbonic anhydrase [Gammaproteobacteria bacterium]|nr:carbonic anhydrase [Gammaproteobacteria bacterium]